MHHPTPAAGRTAVTTSTEPGPVETYLRRIMERVPRDEIPMIDHLTEDDLGTPRGSASIARAALSVLRSKHPDVIRADLERELREADWLAAWRLRRMSGDLATVPWLRLHEVDRARAAPGDPRYRDVQPDPGSSPTLPRARGGGRP